MYRQILVDPRDIDYQRILWHVNDSSCSTAFRLLTVTYGTACAPFLALRVIQQLVLDDSHEFPLATDVLKGQIYVDDVLFRDNDPSRLREIRDQLRALLQRGGFDLRKWASNASSLLSDINPENHGLACHKLLEPDDKVKVLGIGWHPESDHFQFQVQLPSDAPQSKRAILSTIAKLFDPLSWVTPVIIKAKIYLQFLWSLKLNWDDPIPSNHTTQWQLIYRKLIHLNSISLPRWMNTDEDSTHYELHGFADASSVAYAAVVYLKAISSSGEVSISLVMGKSKVAPVKPLSIPRLELSAAVLLSRLVRYVQESIELKLTKVHCWTDSTIVLAWLRQHPSKWKIFVANRVAEIQSNLPATSWSHVNTHENPADCASRGLFGDELLTHPLWWHGPSWLRSENDYSPTTVPDSHSDDDLELKVASLLTMPTSTWTLPSRFSSWFKLLRVSAYLMRFVTRCRRQSSLTMPPSALGVTLAPDEIQMAKRFWLRHIQETLFPRELTALRNSTPLARTSSILSLNPFLDHDGIIRVGGRLRHSLLSFSAKHPVLLADHPLVTLIIRSVHLKSLHAGLQLTLTTLRREFWIMRARSVVRNVIFQCVACTREKAVSPSQLMGDLPAPRVTPSSRSFLHCGIDYAGPIQVRTLGGRGFKSRKAYIALFVCLASKTIHLELVSDYSTTAFLDAFSRFCARRGLPESMYSDNGTTFVGADRDLQRAYRTALNDSNLRNAIASDNITWHFLPPSAPHFGGLWEAGVRSVKHHVRRIVKNHVLTYEEFTTLLCRVEACLNSRPLAPLTDSPDDYEILTPGHFLIGSALTVTPEPSVLDLNENRLSRWQRVRQITERFWRLWTSDYINTLQQRTKWKSPMPSVKLEQMVLLKNATLPPCKWELGRIQECHAGPDGFIRVVTVKTATSEFKRLIVKLCLLPVDTEDRTRSLA